jgi:hypothetical protein
MFIFAGGGGINGHQSSNYTAQTARCAFMNFVAARDSLPTRNTG